MIHAAHQIRLNPTAAQAGYFLRAAGIARLTYNWALEEYKRVKSLGQKADWNELQKAFCSKIDAEFPFVREVTKCAYQGGIKDLRRSISTYYKAKQQNPRIRFPKRRSRSKRIGGFYLANDLFAVAGQSCKVPKLGLVNMTEPLRFTGRILSGRITEKAGRWYLTVVVEREQPVLPDPIHPSVGIDFGLKDFAVTSVGEVYETQAHFRRNQQKLRRLQRGLARKKKGSNRRRRWKLRVARFQERIANRRKDYLHKFTTETVKRFGVICVEDLNLKGLVRTRMAKSFADAAIGETIHQLEYKSQWYGRRLQRVGRFYPSSKTCSACQTVNQNLVISDRDWTCAQCNASHDRDFNAAVNIETEGLRLLARGSGSLGALNPDVELRASG